MKVQEAQAFLTTLPIYSLPATLEQRALTGYAFDWEKQPDGSCKLLYRTEDDITPMHITTDYARAYFDKYANTVAVRVQWALLADRALWHVEQKYSDVYGEAFGAACAVLFAGGPVPLLSFFKTQGLADEVRAFALSLQPISHDIVLHPSPPPVVVPTTTVVNIPSPTAIDVPTATTRYCFDSTNARDIPAGASIVAGYIDGLYQWSDADWALFPDSVKVRIACFSDTNDGHVGDVEQGDMTPYAGVDWVKMRRTAGVDPTIYCGLGQWGAVRRAFLERNVKEPHYWIAHYDNDLTPIPGTVAKQYANPTWTGKHYDLSIVPGRWPGVEGEDMDRDTFNQWFDERYKELGVAKKFDDLNGALSGEIAKKADKAHPHTANTTVS